MWNGAASWESCWDRLAATVQWAQQIRRMITCSENECESGVAAGSQFRKSAGVSLWGMSEMWGDYTCRRSARCLRACAMYGSWRAVCARCSLVCTNVDDV
jgi:hypothetical protein